MGTIAIPEMTRDEVKLAARCVRARIFARAPDHPLAQFLIAQRQAIHIAAVCTSGPGPHAHLSIAEYEARQAADLLATWRSSEHWRRFLSQPADTMEEQP